MIKLSPRANHAPRSGIDLRHRLAVIIPASSKEPYLGRLLQNLSLHLPAGVEVILCVPKGASKKEWSTLSALYPITIVTSAKGRARQMNAGIAATRREFLWFLHADSELSESVWPALERSVADDPGALHYFDLAFSADGPFLTCLNSVAANWRSRCLNLPFGDQGLCLQRQHLLHLRGYSEKVRFGEDHVLVWRLRQNGVRLRRVGTTIWTSARKYRDGGWLKTTLEHSYWTLKQATPEAWRLVVAKIGLMR